MGKRIALIAVILVTGLVLARTLLAEQGVPAQKNGWWIKIDTNKTQCDTIRFDIGVNKESRVEWKLWRKGDPAEFDVPDAYRGVAELYIHAQVNPVKKPGVFDIKFMNNGVKRMSIEDQNDASYGQAHYDSDCQ